MENWGYSSSIPYRISGRSAGSACLPIPYTSTAREALSLPRRSSRHYQSEIHGSATLDWDVLAEAELRWAASLLAS